jgi:hypothetical protein
MIEAPSGIARGGMLDQEVGTSYVHVELRIEEHLIHPIDGGRLRHSRVDEEHVDAAVTSLDLIDQRPRRSRVAGIGGDHLDVIQIASGRLQGLGIGAGHDHRRAFGLEQFRCCRPHPARTAGDECDFSFQTSHR